MDSGYLVCNSSYSLMLILLKLYRCCDHALKICIVFGYNPQINFCYFFSNLNLAILGHFDNKSKWTVGTLFAQLLQFNTNSLETSQML